MSSAKAQPGNSKGAGAFSAWEFLLAFRYLRTRRKHGGVTLISVISFIGITLAVTALIAVMSIMNGFRHELLSRLLGVQPHVYVYTAESAALTGDLVDRINQVPGVRQAGPIIAAQALISSERGASGAQVIGVRPSDLGQFDLIAGEGDAAAAGGGIVQGSADDFGVGHHGGDGILIGSGIAAQLGVSAGDTVTLLAPQGASTPMGTVPRRKNYVVDGVVSMGVLDLDRIYVFMPLEQAALFFGRSGGADYIDIRVTNPDAPEAVVEAVRQLVPPGTAVFDWRRQNQSFWTALQVERMAMRMILSIIVLIAAMNIISGLVMLVKNKSRDIAILRTMGATQGAVMRVFLISGAAIGVLGTIAGIILGVLIAVFIGPIQDFLAFVTGVDVFDPSVYLLYRLPARLDWAEVAFVAVWGFATALIATLPPSWRAGRIDPVEALRYE
ncbi:LolC/E family lipoprotein releasing system, transmembrane protein [Glycocaulis alkaliphilus]|uniref:LolC/E family lipoprotein releasing system, transmembrane protein n=1 Tax=Glycocaulis alkaliphilus TaxID=1434191 RepID=A0A3T0EA81_9PROT|nr:lipoprotein-releasing ABC transporter permease subunit [Glycocaulis alkaliphilus]AZU04311.1 LolC/E family lipoprotein releasing system, transmembrane protein [Glycocaulis alkaliphilus]GGB77414.1 multidrug ABC transporter substrate-binding protein [Glycocaulis alkaliphilus]